MTASWSVLWLSAALQSVFTVPCLSVLFEGAVLFDAAWGGGGAGDSDLACFRVPDGASSVRLRFGPGFLLCPAAADLVVCGRGVSSVLLSMCRAYAFLRTSVSSPPSSVEETLLLLHHQGPRPRSQQPRPPLPQWLRDRLSGGGRRRHIGSTGVVGRAARPSLE